jgi:UDP-N-acetylmuramyl pentapeptide phosphotransferase/UDP-N-acetylglucosamine-1-phosphate transferase
MKYMTYFCGLLAFLVVWFAVPWLIRYLRRLNLVVKDMHKEGKPLIPSSGGLAVMAGIFIGLMCFIFFRTFFNGVTLGANVVFYYFNSN